MPSRIPNLSGDALAANPVGTAARLARTSPWPMNHWSAGILAAFLVMGAVRPGSLVGYHFELARQGQRYLSAAGGDGGLGDFPARPTNPNPGRS